VTQTAASEQSSLPAVAEAELATFPGARGPDRSYSIYSDGLRLAVYEWGDAAAPPLLLAHGGGDFARAFDVFAPLLAERGRRVVTWDQRGHGDSEAAHFYGWDADVRDAVAVLEALEVPPVPVIGHSKGGMVVTRLAVARPERVSHLVNLDGFPSPPDYPVGAGDEMIGFRMREMSRWLDFRRGGDSANAGRPPRTLEELATRRHQNCQRLTLDWMRYLVTVGAQWRPDGWRWKLDPGMSQLISNPIRLDWPLIGMSTLRRPTLAVLGLVHETLHMGATEESVVQFLPPRSQLVTYADSGHFIHVEHPQRVADLIESFLG
jgi:pimeloyl-ACP methyl ester carboxylesterase